MADKYEVKIRTEGDVSGVQKVDAALNATGRTAGRLGEEAQGTSRRLNELGEAGEKGAAAGRNLAAVLEGNVGALAMLGTQLKAIGTVVRSNPLGAIFVGLTAGLALLPSLISRFRATTAATGEAGEAAAESAPKFKALADAMEKAGSAQSDALTAALAAIKTEAKGAADELERVLRLRGEIDRLNASEARAGVEADPNLTPEQKKRRLAEIEQEQVDRDRSREDEKLGLEYSSALEARTRTQAELERARAAEAEFTRSLEADAAARARRSGLEAELADLQRQPGGTSPEAMARGDRMQQIATELEGLRSLDDPAQKQFLEEQRKRALRARTDVEKAQREAASADEAFRQVGRDVVGVDREGRAIRDPQTMINRGREDRLRRQSAGVPEPDSAIDAGGRVESSTVPRTGPDTTPTVRDAASMREAGSPAAAAETSAETARIIQELRDWNTAAQNNADATLSQLREIVDEIRRNRQTTETQGEQIRALRR